MNKITRSKDLSPGFDQFCAAGMGEGRCVS